jgi:Flp pilus assembly protein TadD
VVTASFDYTARLWDAATGQLLAPSLKHSQIVLDAALSPDSRRVVTASLDGPARIWELTSDERPVEDLILVAQLLAGYKVDDSGSLDPLETPELGRIWHVLHPKYPQDFESPCEATLAWCRRQAEQCAQNYQWAEAAGYLDRVISARPIHWLDLVDRGRVHGELGQFKEAAADYAQAIELGASDPEVAYCLGVALLAGGDQAGYRRICAKLLERSSPSTEVDSAARWTVKICTLSANADSDYTRPVSLAQQLVSASPRDPRYLMEFGVALYRSGRFDRAIEVEQKVLETAAQNRRPIASLFLAMAHQRLGHPNEATEHLVQARTWMEQEGTPLKPTDSKSFKTGFAWNQRWEMEFWRREAEALMKGKN